LAIQSLGKVIVSSLDFVGHITKDVNTMLTYKNNNTFALDIMNDPEFLTFINKYVPDMYSEKKTYLSRISYKAGKTTGKLKNFFSRTETKSATLLAYWAADTLVATFLIFTSTSLIAVTIAAGLLVLHTYATFSIVAEVM